MSVCSCVRVCVCVAVCVCVVLTYRWKYCLRSRSRDCLALRHPVINEEGERVGRGEKEMRERKGVNGREKEGTDKKQMRKEK